MKRAAKIEKVALYARVSTNDGRQDTENQLIALREYCAKHDIPYIENANIYQNIILYVKYLYAVGNP